MMLDYVIKTFILDIRMAVPMCYLILYGQNMNKEKFKELHNCMGEPL